MKNENFRKDLYLKNKETFNRMDSLEISCIDILRECLISFVFRTLLIDLTRREVYSPRVSHADETFENKASLINRNERSRRLTKTKFARCCRLPG